MAMLAVVGVFGARSLAVARADAITWDEATYAVHGLHFWMTGDDLAMWQLGAPRLPHLTTSLASYIALRATGRLPAANLAAIRSLVLSNEPRMLLPARLVAIGMGVALLLTVFWAVARSRGAITGLVAAGLLSLVPEVLAHAAIAGSDLPFAAAAVLALALLARFAERPTSARWLAAALAVGLAWATRHTAMLLLPLAAGAYPVAVFLHDHPRGVRSHLRWLGRSLFASLGLLPVVAGLVLWAADGLECGTVGGLSRSVPLLRVPTRIGPLDVSRWPVPTSAASVLRQVEHQKISHEAYLMGVRRVSGSWRAYFPLAFALKTPLGLLALMVLAIARCWPRGAFEWLGLAFLYLFWAVLIRSKVDIGLRYALLTYPLAVPFLARLFEPWMLRDRLWGPLTLGALVWFAAGSVGAHPRYLSSFNELGGGPRWGWMYLSDSNVDWGQDVDTLAATLLRLGVAEVTVDLASQKPLRVPGVRVEELAARPERFPAGVTVPSTRSLPTADGRFLPVSTRYVAVSVTRLHGLYTHRDLSWLWTRRLLARAGDGTFVFDMDRPAAEPFTP